MELKKYFELIRAVLDDANLTEEQKIKIIRQLDKISSLEEQEIGLLENRFYQVNGSKLSEQEKIVYEINRFINYTDVLPLENLDFTIDEFFQKIKQLAYKNYQRLSKEQRNDLKTEINILQIKCELPPSFITNLVPALEKTILKTENIFQRKF